MAARCLDSRNLSLQPGNREVGGCNRVVGDGAAVFDPVIEL